MSRKPFQFKQFAIYQDKTAMKVGTDGVLLGAFVSETNPKRMLDIGTGTGLIALMMAQKYHEANIEAIEIDLDAFEQAQENFQLSIWSQRLTLFHGDIKHFEPKKTYDTIVSNPPFYNATFKDLPHQRATARHTLNLNFDTLIEKVALLLSKNGCFYVIIPFYEEGNFIALAKSKGLYPSKILHVKGNPESEIKRSLIQFSFEKRNIEMLTLTIEKSRNEYTQAYIDLTKDFYLKM
jgi:tRNA1Val (adenine37-N6)-methyltransferase